MNRRNTAGLEEIWTWPDSLWVATATPDLPTEALEAELVLDTAIVGGGFTGLRAALVLAEAGQRVAVLEERAVGWGASGRNGGQVNPLPPLNGPDRIAQLVGTERFPLLAKTILGSADETFDVISRYAIDCGARQKGWIRTDHCDKAKRQSRAVAEAWNRFGADIAFLDGPEVEEATGTKGYKSATLIGAGGALQPLSYARGLARAALAAGAAIYSKTPAITLEQDGARWKIRTPRGRVTADRVLLCTNGYTDKLWPGLAQTVVPLVSIQAATEPLSGAAYDSILPHGRTMADTRRTIIYGRHEPDGRILFGGIGSVNGHDDAAFDAMRQGVEQLYPALRGVRWEYRWGGQIAVTQDHLPHLHEPAPGLLAGLGYNGRGVAMSTVMGRVLAERILGKADADCPFPVSPIKAYPLRRFYQLGADLVVRIMRYQDEREVRRG